MNKDELEKILEDYPVSLSAPQLAKVLGIERQTALMLMEKAVIPSYLLNPASKKKHYRVLKKHVIEHILNGLKGDKND